MQRAATLAFYLAALVSFVMAVIPHPPPLPGSPSDKVLHMLAFATLAALGTIAFPSLSLLRLILGLIAFGALIEAIQAIPALNRDSDIIDLLADAIAAVAAGGLTTLVLRRCKL